MQNLVETKTQCNPDDHVLYGCCDQCEELPAYKDATEWVGYDEFLVSSEAQQGDPTPWQLLIKCNCKDESAHQCALISLGADYGQRRFKTHIDYMPCDCVCHCQF